MRWRSPPASRKSRNASAVVAKPSGTRRPAADNWLSISPSDAFLPPTDSTSVIRSCENGTTYWPRCMSSPGKDGIDRCDRIHGILPVAPVSSCAASKSPHARSPSHQLRPHRVLRVRRHRHHRRDPRPQRPDAVRAPALPAAAHSVHRLRRQGARGRRPHQRGRRTRRQASDRVLHAGQPGGFGNAEGKRAGVLHRDVRDLRRAARARTRPQEHAHDRPLAQHLGQFRGLQEPHRSHQFRPRARRRAVGQGAGGGRCHPGRRLPVRQDADQPLPRDAVRREGGQLPADPRGLRTRPVAQLPCPSTRARSSACRSRRNG